MASAYFRQMMAVLAAGGAPGGYDVILLIGQSNMVGQGTYSAGTDTPLADSYQFASDPASGGTYRTLIACSDPLYHPLGVNASLMGLGVSFAKRYKANTTRNVVVVPVAWNQTCLVGSEASWDPETGARFAFAVDQANRAVTAALAALPGSRFVGTACIQGESDGDDRVPQAKYQARFADMIAAIRAGVTGATSSWFVIGSMVPEAVTGRPGVDVIDLAHKAIPALVAKTAFVAGVSGQTADSLHYNAAGLRTMGTNMADAVPTAQANAGSAAAAPSNVEVPQIHGAPIEGQTLTATKGFWANVATAWLYQWKRDGANISGATSQTYVVQSADIGTVLTVGVVASNAAGAGSEAVSAATPAVQAVGGSYTYTFESDTAISRPAGVKIVCGDFKAKSTGLPAGWTGKAAHFATGVFSANAYIIDLLNAPITANQSVTWKRGSTSVGNGRDSMVLRSVAGTTCTGRLVVDAKAGGVAAKRGYEFLVLGQGGQLRINRLDATAVTQLGSSYTLADTATRYFRATCNGTTLTFEFSPDGVSWTTAITVTDSTYAAAGSVQLLNGIGCNAQSSTYFDDIVCT